MSKLILSMFPLYFITYMKFAWKRVVGTKPKPFNTFCWGFLILNGLTIYYMFENRTTRACNVKTPKTGHLVVFMYKTRDVHCVFHMNYY